MFPRNFFSESLSAWPALTVFHNVEKQGYWPTFSLSLYNDEITKKTFLQLFCPKSRVQHWNTPSDNKFEACIKVLGTQAVGQCSWMNLDKQQQRGRESCVYLEGDSPKRNSSRCLRKDRPNTAVIWKEFPSCEKQLCNKLGSSGIRNFLATIIQMLLYPSLLLFSGCLLLG